MDNRLLEILANKPELVDDFPDWMLPPSTMQIMIESSNSAIAEIAGRDSIAAVLRACELRPLDVVLPTVAYTGTEYGDWAVTLEKVSILKNILNSRHVRVFDPVVIGAPRFWWKLCGRYTTHFVKKYGDYSPCVGCHLYFHAIRIPLARKLHCALVVGGERESHDGRLKVNQISISLDSYQAFMDKFGIELYLPIRQIKTSQEIESILDMPWNEGDEQVECVLSKNYLEADGSVSLQEEAIMQYFQEFAFPTAEAVIKSYRKRASENE